MHDASTTMAPAPPQHMQALQRANEVRLARASLKRSIGVGAVTVDEVILTCPWEAASMTIAELLDEPASMGDVPLQQVPRGNRDARRPRRSAP